jgi:hypothetical protein
VNKDYVKLGVDTTCMKDCVLVTLGMLVKEGGQIKKRPEDDGTCRFSELVFGIAARASERTYARLFDALKDLRM